MNIRSGGEHQSLSIRATTEEEADQSDSELELPRSMLPSKVPCKPVVCSFFLGKLLCCSYTWLVARIWHQHVNILCIGCSSWIDIINALVALIHIIEHVMNPSAEYQVFFSYKDDNSSSFVASSEQLVPILNFANITPFQQERNVILRISTDIALRWTGCCSEWAFLVADPPVISYIAFQVTLNSFSSCCSWYISRCIPD